MSETYVLSLAQNALMVALMVAGPVLIISLVIGSLVSLVQAATQINEVTLTFIPKIIGIALVFLLLGAWMLQQLVQFTVNLFQTLPNLVH
ncbi:MAG: flagellar biosynthesis protein FliQ [Thermanaerothrix sp.]|uniref:Flagellar biosynthetic protein FliQ n=1 Tax=Thermanaerothrix solaris TaxID=3058434 RepID=A0ABU3NLE6_9CHLR|nr:flagellar biosynthesis protein FliQ [Thermanaerothrix sp. 4228-RoL]MDT8897656.1 flagellar biosynthesis protein FliQ [Thermanaerothrix sp. 4228-RoL]